jgi:acyl carrier protein
MDYQKLIKEELASLDLLVPIEDTTVLYGASGVLDSLDLVRFIVGLEQSLFTNTGKNIYITSDKIMSYKNSPFQSVSKLANFLEDLCKKK